MPPQPPASTSHGEHRSPPLSQINKNLTSQAGADCPPPHTDRPRAQAVTGNGGPIARVDRPVPSECHWHSSMHPTRGTKNNAFSSLSFPLNPVIMCWRDFDSYLIMNHSFSCTQKESTSDDMPSVYVLAYIAIIYQHKRLRFAFQIHLLP